MIEYAVDQSKGRAPGLGQRGLFKLAFAAALALALAGALMPAFMAHKAFAAPAAPGVYTVTANLYADKADTPIHENAYLTNPGNPPFHKPVAPVSDNAKLEIKADGTKLLTVPIVNDTFGLLALPAASTDKTVKVVGTVKSPWKAPLPLFTYPPERISLVTFDVSDFAAGSSVATLSPSSEHVTFFLYHGDKAWDLYLSADLSAAGL